MLITARFLVLNLPKSGSSFVRSVLKELYRHRRGWYPAWWLLNGDHFLKELILPNVRLPDRPKDQHGIAAQIPRRFRDRAIVSVLRDPYAKLVSDYRFRWWATYPPLPEAELARLFPRFPTLSFDEYLRLSDRVAARKVATTAGVGTAVAADAGNLTVEFVQFFFRDPAAVLRRLSDDYVASGAFRADMVPVTFLRQERLADELADFLAANGFSAAEAERARVHAPVNVTDGTPGDVAWSPWGLAHVEERERHLFAMLEALGFRYPRPRRDIAGDPL